MKEYEDVGHMNQINEDASSVDERYYLPHLAVFKSYRAKFNTRFSTLSRLHIVGAYCLILAHNTRNPSRTGFLTSTELRDALHACIKKAQLEIYALEINDLCKKCHFINESIATSASNLDEEGYLRIG
jgi:hypothetical protein